MKDRPKVTARCSQGLKPVPRSTCLAASAANCVVTANRRRRRRQEVSGRSSAEQSRLVRTPGVPDGRVQLGRRTTRSSTTDRPRGPPRPVADAIADIHARSRGTYRCRVSATRSRSIRASSSAEAGVEDHRQLGLKACRARGRRKELKNAPACEDLRSPHPWPRCHSVRLGAARTVALASSSGRRLTAL